MARCHRIGQEKEVRLRAGPGWRSELGAAGSGAARCAAPRPPAAARMLSPLPSVPTSAWAKQVTIYRLVSKNTYEQNVFEISSRKYGERRRHTQLRPGAPLWQRRAQAPQGAKLHAGQQRSRAHRDSGLVEAEPPPLPSQATSTKPKHQSNCCAALLQAWTRPSWATWATQAPVSSIQGVTSSSRCAAGCTRHQLPLAARPPPCPLPILLLLGCHPQTYWFPLVIYFVYLFHCRQPRGGQPEDCPAAEARRPLPARPGRRQRAGGASAAVPAPASIAGLGRRFQPCPWALQRLDEQAGLLASAPGLTADHLLCSTMQSDAFAAEGIDAILQVRVAALLLLLLACLHRMACTGSCPRRTCLACAACLQPAFRLPLPAHFLCCRAALRSARSAGARATRLASPPLRLAATARWVACLSSCTWQPCGAPFCKCCCWRHCASAAHPTTPAHAPPVCVLVCAGRQRRRPLLLGHPAAGRGRRLLGPEEAGGSLCCSWAQFSAVFPLAICCVCCCCPAAGGFPSAAGPTAALGALPTDPRLLPRRCAAPLCCRRTPQ